PLGSMGSMRRSGPRPATSFCSATLAQRMCWCPCPLRWRRHLRSFIDSINCHVWGIPEDHNHLDGVATFTLRFSNPQQEHGFAVFRKARLSRSASNYAIVTLFIYLIMLANLLRSGMGPSSSHFAADLPTDDGRDLMKLKLILNSVVVFVYVFVLFVGKSLALRGRIGPGALEITIVVSVTFLMSFVALTTSHYMARIAGHDNTRAVFGFSAEVMATLDTHNLLMIDLCVTVAHLAPIRWVALLPLEVAAVLVYVVPAYIIGSTVPAARALNSITLFALTLLAAIGRRACERQERLLFSGLLTEKRQRFQAEFQLCERQAGTTGQGGEPSECSRPDTTASGQAFEVAGDGSLLAMRAVGEKEGWLVRESDVVPLSGRSLGEGSFGVVTGGLYHSTFVAIKAPKQDVWLTDRGLDSLCNELRILRRLRHPNIMFLYGACLNDSLTTIFLVLEFVRGVTLTDFICQASSSYPSQSDRVSIAIDVVNALRYMHSRKPVVVHGDLKSSNVIVEQVTVRPSGTDAIDECVSACAKLLDFGLSRLLTRSSQSLGGTTRWRAPELFQHEHVRPDAAADVYSMGQLLFFIAAKEKPFHGTRTEDVARSLKRGSVPCLDWPASCDSEWLPQRSRAVVEWCTRKEPAARPSSEQVSAELSRVLRWDPARVASGRILEGASGSSGSCHWAPAAAAPLPPGAPPRASPDDLEGFPENWPRRCSPLLPQEGPGPPPAGVATGSGSCKRGTKGSSGRPGERLPAVPEHAGLERCGASVYIWFDVVSAKWSILQAASCFELFWGQDHAPSELGSLTRWIHPDVRENLIPNLLGANNVPEARQGGSRAQLAGARAGRPLPPTAAAHCAGLPVGICGDSAGPRAGPLCGTDEIRRHEVPSIDGCPPINLKHARSEASVRHGPRISESPASQFVLRISQCGTHMDLSTLRPHVLQYSLSQLGNLKPSLEI
ncbi:unnamed protein product, partial [Prorocentrum cordatum]